MRLLKTTGTVATDDQIQPRCDANGNLLVATPAGSSTITEYTEDAVSAADPVGPMLIARRRDTLVANEVSATGDNIALNATNKGELCTNDAAANAALGATTGAAVVTDANGTVQQYLRGLVKFFANALGAGTAAAANRVTLASDDPLIAKTPALGTAGTPSADVITIQQPTSNRWSYAAATGGISNTTTAVTIKAAGAASVRNYLSSLQYEFQPFTTASEIAIRDGAGGTVLWRGYVPTGTAGVREIKFDPPLQGTAATLMEFLTLTASGAGAIFVNVQGFTGA